MTQLQKQTWHKLILEWGRNIGCLGLGGGCVRVWRFMASQGRSIMASCSAHTSSLSQARCSVAGSRAALWKMELRRLHLACGVMPRETLTGGNTRVHWHFSTAWSMRPIKAHRTHTHTDLDPRHNHTISSGSSPIIKWPVHDFIHLKKINIYWLEM